MDFDYPQLEFRISRAKVWHTQNSEMIQNLEISEYTTLPEIERLRMLAYQKVANYWLIFWSSRSAKIHERCILLYLFHFLALFLLSC